MAVVFGGRNRRYNKGKGYTYLVIHMIMMMIVHMDMVVIKEDIVDMIQMMMIHMMNQTMIQMNISYSNKNSIIQ